MLSYEAALQEAMSVTICISLCPNTFLEKLALTWLLAALPSFCATTGSCKSQTHACVTVLMSNIHCCSTSGRTYHCLWQTSVQYPLQQETHNHYTNELINTKAFSILAHTSSFSMASANSPGVGLHRKPVTPCCTLSLGPPVSQAMTGLPDAMASKGTIPKCSFWGVYTTAVHAASRAALCPSVKEGSRYTCGTAGLISSASAIKQHCFT